LDRKKIYLDKKGLNLPYHFTGDDLRTLSLEQNSIYNIKFPKNIGYINIKNSTITENISILKKDNHFNNKATLGFADFNSSENVFHINITLEGNDKIKLSDTKQTLNLSQGNTVTSFGGDGKGLRINNDSPFKAIGILVKGDFLEKHLFSKIEDTKIINNQTLNLFKNGTTNIKTQICAQELFYMQDQENDSLSSIYKESKVLEIIYNEFKDILNAQKQSTVKTLKLDEYDIQALCKAKEILINNIQNPPNITELSKLVKLNKFKFQHGFKKKFNITPYKLLEQARMEKAKYLLEYDDMNVNEISQAVGYKYQNNFSKIFKQYYKISPKELMKSRKYYY